MKNFMNSRTKKHIPIILLILLNILFAIIWGSDFGDSWDEQARYDYALESINNFAQISPEKRIGDKGPIYFVFAKFGGDLIQTINPNLSDIQSWHYMHFAMFLLGLLAFHSINLRLLQRKSAFLSTVLFNTQPVLFGHAFINPKDIPFMSFFLLTISTGLSINDNFSKTSTKQKEDQNPNPILHALIHNWQKINPLARLISIATTLLTVIVPLILLVCSQQVQRWIYTYVNRLDRGVIYNILDRMTNILFRGGIESGITINNVRTVYPYFFTIITLELITVFFLVIVLFYPDVAKILTGFYSWKEFRIKLASILKDPQIYLAAIIFGIAITNRTITVAAGFFVLFSIWNLNRPFFIPTTLTYLILALIVQYLSWPALWGNPLLGILKSVFKVSKFSWGGRTLYWGTALGSGRLPNLYLPTLMSIQITIPALLLSAIGLFSLKQYLTFGKEKKTLIFIITGWFLIPLASALLIDPATYDNFRHYLFLIPPLFFFAGLGINYLFQHLRPSWIKLSLVFIIIFPGVWGIISLHPYQYIYYNEFIGGVQGAYKEFEMDYWGTSYKECTLYLNKIAPESATVLVSGPAHIVKNYARKDMEILKYHKPDEHWMLERADYAIIFSRGNRHLYLLNEYPIIYSVTRNGATLSVIREITPDS